MSDNDFPCLNEDYGLECEYPFCSCEEEYYADDEVEDVVDFFSHIAIKWPTEYNGEWVEDE
jgi:hypothetical protein